MHSYLPQTWSMRQKNHKFEGSLDYTALPGLKKFKIYNARANIIQILSLYEKDWKKSIRARKGLGPGWKDELALLVFIKNRI